MSVIFTGMDLDLPLLDSPDDILQSGHPARCSLHSSGKGHPWRDEGQASSRISIIARGERMYRLCDALDNGLTDFSFIAETPESWPLPASYLRAGNILRTSLWSRRSSIECSSHFVSSH